jgi:hypothetical protein
VADSDTILADPLFQVNLVLWMLQPLPDRAPVRPLLREAGFLLESIGRRLTILPEYRPRLRELGFGDGAPVPDIVAIGLEECPALAIECKSNSFGPESSDAWQAARILVAADSLPATLGKPGGSGQAAYVTQYDEHERLAATLAALRERLVNAGLRAAVCWTLGLQRVDMGVAVARSEILAPPPTLMRLLVNPAVVLHLARDEDPRPLYLIPWDPSVQQDAAMRKYCQDVLFARVAQAAAAYVGQTVPPALVSLEGRWLLSEASSGLAHRWRDRSAVARAEAECVASIRRALNPIADRVQLRIEGNPIRVEIELRDQATVEATALALARLDPTVHAPIESGQLAFLE